MSNISSKKLSDEESRQLTSKTQFEENVWTRNIETTPFLQIGYSIKD
jgi:hypothetical protein